MSEKERQAIEEFIREHKKHTKRFLSGVAGSEPVWLIRCAECEDDYRVDLPVSEEDADKAIEMQIELDELADELTKRHKCECACLDWM